MLAIKSVRILMLTLLASAALAMTACSTTRTQKSPGEQIDDTVVTTRVKAALIDNPTTKARQIDVEVFRGTVQLNGFVDTAAEKNEAARVARAIEGVASVRNNLEVRPSSSATNGEMIDDASLTSKVKAALVANTHTKAHQINVETNQGVVQLSGFVNSAGAKSTATEVARSVAGVKSVRNELDVK